MRMRSFKVLSSILAVMLFVSAAFATQQQTPVITVPISTTISESLSASIQSGTLDPSVSNALTLTVNYSLLGANHSSGLQVGYWTGTVLTNSLGGPTVPAAQIEVVNNGNATCSDAPSVPGGNGTWTQCGGPQTLLTQAQLTATPSGTATTAVSLAYSSPVTNPGTYTGTLSIVVYAL